MNLIYIAIIIFQVGVIIYFIRRGRMQQKPQNGNPAITNPSTFEERRNLSLKVTPDQLKLAIPATDLLVYAVIMDWNMGEVQATLAAYITGAANMYLSTGEHMTGGGLNPIVGEAAVDFVLAAQEYIPMSIQVTLTELPMRGCMRFYLLTNKGIFAAQEQVGHLEAGTSPWLALFEKGNVVITEMNTGAVRN